MIMSLNNLSLHQYQSLSQATMLALQIRLPSGSALVQTFSASEQLAAVRLYVEMNRKDGGTGPVGLMTTFPRKVFTEEEMDMPLSQLGE